MWILQRSKLQLLSTSQLFSFKLSLCQFPYKPLFMMHKELLQVVAGNYPDGRIILEAT
jgi:hypothetical protein